MKRFALFMFIAVILTGCGAEKEEASPDPNEIIITKEEALDVMYDYVAPDFSLKDLDGHEVSLEDHRGKIIFLNFWQTWCPPCRDEMPLFEEMMAAHDDVVVLAIAPLAGERVSGAKAEQGVREYVEENGFTFPVLIEPAEDGGISRHEMYAAPYVPANYIIDREGIIRFAIEGAYSEEMIDILLAYMRALDE